MLLLNRKKGEMLIIGDNIEISIIDVQGETVKLGIAAPRSVSVYRKEIYDDIVRSNRQAVGNMVDIGDKIKVLQDIVRKED
ncbi:MAG: carbon storage regulator CsrA [Syntrophomonadaceae bacterium]